MEELLQLLFYCFSHKEKKNSENFLSELSPGLGPLKRIFLMRNMTQPTDYYLLDVPKKKCGRRYLICIS